MDTILVTIGDKEHRMAKMSCGALRRGWSKFSALRAKVAEAKVTEDGGEQLLFDLSAVQNTFIADALKRVNPEITLDYVEDSLSPGESTAIFYRLMDFSNMVKAKDETKSGEAARP